MRVSIVAVLAVAAATYPSFTNAIAIGNFRISGPASGLRSTNIQTRAGWYGGGPGPVMINGRLAGMRRDELEARSPRATHHMEGELVAREYADLEARAGVFGGVHSGGGHGPIMISRDLEARSPRATHHMTGERITRSEYADLEARDLDARSGIYGGGHGPIMINGRPFGMKREDLEARSPRATHHHPGELLAREYDDLRAHDLDARSAVNGGSILSSGGRYGTKREDLETRSPRATHHMSGERLTREIDDFEVR